MKTRAFTLIELMIIVVIVSLLAALLFPILKSSMEKSKAAVCVGNLKTIGAGFAQFAADNNMAVPYNGPGNNLTWVQILAPYVDSSVKPFPNPWIPSDSDFGVRPPGVWSCPASKALTKRGAYSDYAKNVMISESANKTTTDPQRADGRMARIRDAAKLFLVGDGGDGDKLCERDLFPNRINNSGLIPRHSGKANVLFFDYHVEAVDPTMLPANSWETQTQPPWSNGPNQ